MAASWLAIYPAITVLLAVMPDALREAPLVLRTLALTVVLVPFMVLVGVPIATAAVDKGITLMIMWNKRG